MKMFSEREKKKKKTYRYSEYKISQLPKTSISF